MDTTDGLIQCNTAKEKISRMADLLSLVVWILVDRPIVAQDVIKILASGFEEVNFHLDLSSFKQTTTVFFSINSLMTY